MRRYVIDVRWESEDSDSILEDLECIQKAIVDNMKTKPDYIKPTFWNDWKDDKYYRGEIECQNG